MNKLLTTICLIVGKEKRQYKCQHLDGTIYRYNSGVCPGSAFFNIYANESFNLTELKGVWNYLMTQHFMLVIEEAEQKQPIYRRTPMPKCDFNKAALQLY